MKLPSYHNGEALKQYLRHNKIRQGDFAEKLGISRNYLLTKLKEYNFKDDFKRKVITLLQLSNNFFESNNNDGEIGGNVLPITPAINAFKIGEIAGDEENSPFIDIGNGQYIMVVPIVPIKAQAGYIQNYNDEQYIAENFTEKHTFSVSRVYRGRYMAFIVDGDSMDDGTSGAIIEGSTVTGREIQKHHWHNKFHINRYKDYVIVHHDGIFVKRIIEHDTTNGTIICHSLNPDKNLYADFELNLDECLQIFNVVNVTQTR